MAKTKQQPHSARKLTADEQIIEMKRLLPKATAWLLNVRSARTLNENIALGGLKHTDGTYDAQAILQYASTTRRRRTDRPGDRARMAANDAGADGVSSDGTILDYKRKLEAKKLELQLLEAEKKVVSVDMVRDFLLLVANRLKQLGGTLQSQYGRDALLLLQEAIDDMDATVKRWEDGLRDSEFEL